MKFEIDIHEPSFKKLAKKYHLTAREMGERIRQQTVSAILDHDWTTLALSIEDNIGNAKPRKLRIIEDGRGMWEEEDDDDDAEE